MLIIFAVALLLAGIVVVVMIHLCVVWQTIGRFSNLAEAEDHRNLIKGVSAEELKKLPCYDYKAGVKGRGSEAECAVCLEGFQVGQRCRLLPVCRHSFHADCVDSWLMKTAICPICRSRVRERVCGSVAGDRRRDELELQEIAVVESGAPPPLHGSAALL
ncbi:RING-H2 finger protein ATL56 [Dendrobium catenatum]|uniref:RING-H2 finger protein ATL56 n=1 Tax=Dendrobium catenatum TaxID=906689 RepID=A0A2I0VLC4_9ASPA|nr:RING-H2 finger protein ATL56 [Dendrobium catenatum]PKU64220.1 RING-H2 finger protein ATL56 [Dendrobium catenatum]